MSDQTRERVDTFWELIDEILNAVLFVLIGLEVLLIELSWSLAAASLAAAFVSLAARFLVVGIPVSILRRFKEIPPKVVRIMTWGGLRGGISVALALSLPSDDARGTVVAITYGVVVFSIVVQGLTIGRVLASAGPPAQPAS
jgi:CPA1 family monovalent cation:H+ antiporter